MTKKEKQKAIAALKKSAPVMAMTLEEIADYTQTLNKVIDWLEQKPSCQYTDEEIAKSFIKDVEAVKDQLPNTKETPSQEPNWIPVSERLPNFNDIVLASTDSDYEKLGVILTVYNGEEFWFDGRIKAWMPKPKRYTAESEER